MKIKNFKQFTNESKVANIDNPFGFYTICNSLMPDEFFLKLNEYNISYKHDGYRNYIEVFVKNLEEASLVRELALSDIFIADDIDHEDLRYLLENQDDCLEIKLI